MPTKDPGPGPSHVGWQWLHPPPLLKPDLREALDQLRKAVEDEGRAPVWHDAMVRRVSTDWPELMKAVRAVLAADKR